MTSGRKISKREDRYIRTHRKGMFASKLAENLAKLYPEDNGGYRDPQSLNRYMKKRGYI